MNQIQQITSDGKQKQAFVLPTNDIVVLELEFKPQQLGWFISKLTYKTFVLEGIRICVSPNLLYQFSNQLPFGIAVETTDNFEPMQITDFTSGYATMYFLNDDEVADYVRYVRGQV